MIAAAQTLPERGNVAANIAAHLRFARAAADAQVDLLLFPELSLTGYELDLAAELEFSLHDPRLAPLQEAAASWSMILIVGAPVRAGARRHLAALILSPDGSVELYTKRHLGAFPAAANPGGEVPPPEASVFQPGESDPLLDIRGRQAALAICADVGHPDHSERAAARGAGLYLASMFVIPADLEHDAARLATQARRHAMATVLANYGGPSGGLPSAGSSAIWSERGELLTRLPPAGPGLAIAVHDANGWRAGPVVLTDA